MTPDSGNAPPVPRTPFELLMVNPPQFREYLFQCHIDEAMQHLTDSRIKVTQAKDQATLARVTLKYGEQTALKRQNADYNLKIEKAAERILTWLAGEYKHLQSLYATKVYNDSIREAVGQDTLEKILAHHSARLQALREERRSAPIPTPNRPDVAPVATPEAEVVSVPVSMPVPEAADDQH